MLISVQVISKVIASKSYSLIEDNLLDETYFRGYEEEFNFIKNHHAEFGKVPDEISFLDKFPDFQLVEVEDSDRYLIDTIREQHLYLNFVPAFQKTAEILKTDANAAAEYMMNALKEDLQPSYSFSDTEIVATVGERVENSEYMRQSPAEWFIPTGFPEIDEDINGWQRGEELGVIYARTNHGKSWVLEAMCTHAVKLGLEVGMFSPEMSARNIGYRFDTLYGNISNSTISFGLFNNEFSIDDYKKYAEDLGEVSGHLYVTSPKDFARKVTVSKLRNWIKARNLDMIAIDGITYLTDERFKRGDSKTISLTRLFGLLVMMLFRLYSI